MYTMHGSALTHDLPKNTGGRFLDKSPVPVDMLPIGVSRFTALEGIRTLKTIR